MYIEELEEYREWILKQKDPGYELIDTEDAHRTIIVRTEYAEASASFVDVATISRNLSGVIVELKIMETGREEESFYLHFEFKELPHAKELFEEMITALRKMEDHKKLKIALCCSSALTSSFFADKLNRAAVFNETGWEFRAVSYNRLYEHGFESDVVMLAPQIAYVHDRVRDILKDSLVLKIPARIFGSYDVDGMFSYIRTGIDQKKKNSMHHNDHSISAVKMEGRVLVIAVISEFRGRQFSYRVYHNGVVEMEDRIRKSTYNMRDIEDIIDVVLSRTSVDRICIATPGVVKEGRLTFHEAGLLDIDADRAFTRKYGIPVVFINDANAMALGFYRMQGKYRNLIFYFHPHAARICGTGTIIDGKLNQGRNHIAGEMQFLVKALHWSDDPSELARTPEGSLELVSGYLTAMIASIDPEAVGIYCDMVPDMGELTTEIGRFIRPDCIPMLIKVDDVTEYMFTGAMAYIADQ